MHASHPPTKPWLVQKYGGTSVARFLKKITNVIIPSYLATHRVAVVCSARSGTTKSTGTTSMLLEAIRLATATSTTRHDSEGGNSPAARACAVIDAIEGDHLAAASGLFDQDSNSGLVIGDGGVSILAQKLEQGIREDCEHLREFLTATSTIGEISERAQDHVLATGEKLSCRIVEACLKSKGIDAEMVQLEDLVQDAYRSQDLRDQKMAFKRHPAEFLRGLVQAIQLKIRNCDDRVPVVTGFFGIMPESLVSSVGRGYSDLCAALCSVSIDAEELQIWKEVDGVFTADPNKVSSARLLATITSEEAIELSYYGSEVIHPLTLEQIDSAGIPVRLKNVKNPQGSGTVIFPSPDSPALTTMPTSTFSESRSTTPPGTGPGTPRSVFMATNGYYGSDQQRRTPTAVTSKDAITVINVQSNGRASPQAFLGHVAERLVGHDLMINLISSSKQSISFALSTGAADVDGRNIERAAAELEELGTVTIARHMSIVSVVGHKMRNMVGIAGEIFSALAGARVNIYLISQGASEINISLVVKAQDALRASTVIHSNVLRIPAHSERESNFIKGPWLY